MARLAAQWLRFTLVGVSNTALSLAAFALLERGGVHYLLSSAAAFVLGALNSYALNRRWTFRSDAPPAPELARFLFVQAAGLGTNLVLLAELVEVAGLHHLMAQLIAFPFSSVVTFTLARRWAFAPARSPA